MRGETAGPIFAVINEVYKPSRTGSPDVVEVPKNLVGWLQHHPYLQTSKPEPITVGGVKGKQFDVVVEDLPEDYYGRSEEHTSELQSRQYLVCRLLLEKISLVR